MSRCASPLWARLTAWWPDVYVSLFIAVAAILILINGGTVAYGPGIAKLFPAAGAYVWSAIMLAGSTVAIFGVVRRRWGLASDASLALALLLAVNGAVTIKANGDGAVWASAAYAGLAICLLDRSKRMRAPVPPPPTNTRRSR
jgi:hypothetical protein